MPSCVAHSIESGLRTASTSDEIHRAIFAETKRADVERFAFQKGFDIGIVGRAVWFQMDGEDAAIRPVQSEERTPIGLREIAFRAELRARRRTDANIKNRRQ